MTTHSEKNISKALQALKDLLACFIATNGVGLEKGYAIAEKLVESLIIAIDNQTGLIQCNENLVMSSIVSSSYPRGEYVARLVSNRIQRSVKQINSQGGVKFLESLHLLGESDVRATLSPLYGVGEKFIDNYLIITPRA